MTPPSSSGSLPRRPGPPVRPSGPHRRRRTAVALAAVTVAGLALPAAGASPAGAAAAVAVAGCSNPPGSLTGTPDRSRRLAAGVLVRSWDGRNLRGSRVTVTVAQGALASVRPVAAVPSRLGLARSTADLVARTGAVVGVNGDFFEYDGHGAVVTPGPQVRAGSAQRVPAGWSPFLGVGADGRLLAQELRVTGAAVLPPVTAGGAAPRLAVAAVNAESLPRNAVTLTTGYRNQYRPRAGWEVVLRRGVVVWSGARADFGPGARFRGPDLLLAGTGTAAPALRRLRAGARVQLSQRVVARDGSTVVEAVGRGAVVLAAGSNVARCDGAGLRSRARTLVGWNSAGQVWLLTVDSGGATYPVGGPGLTYHETAELARRLGVTDAVLVDGGGSTTMVAGAGLDRLDAPSWATQRPVPNGFALVARR